MCSKCHKIKSVSDFYKKKRTKDSLDTICIACNKEYQNTRKNIKYEPKTEGYKTCIICGQKLPIINFYVDRRLVDGRTNRCYNCVRKYSKQYKIDNKDKLEKYNKYYDSQIIEKHCIICNKTYKGKRNGTNFCPDCHKSRRTVPELNFINLLEKFDFNYEYEFYIGKYSYDFYLKDYNILIEISPSYTHSINPIGYISKGKTKDYHYNKVQYANSKGFDCVNIWDWICESDILAYIKKYGKLNIQKREIKQHNVNGLIIYDDGQDIIL